MVAKATTQSTCPAGLAALLLSLGLFLSPPSLAQTRDLSMPPQGNSSGSEVTLSPASPDSPRRQLNRYAVLRDGDLIGSHTVTFTPSDTGLVVDIETEMEVKLLFFTAYSYHYQSRENWSQDKLMSVDTKVNDNGTLITTSAQADDRGYRSSKGGVSSFIESSLMPTNHWNKAALLQPALYNTITAQLNDVTIQATSDPQHFEVRGELNIDTFYDQAGNWLGMKFKHDDNSNIEFRCLDCRNTPGVAQ